MAATMKDKSMFQAAGIPMGSFAVKYSNTVDQNGNVVMPDLTEKNLQYEALYRLMVKQDLREYLNRYQWVNVPRGLTANLIERIVYYRFNGLMYYNDAVQKFQFLPYALNKTIDEYGRYTHCNTLPFIGVSEGEAKNGKGIVNYVKQDIEIVYDDLIPAEITECDMIAIQKEWESGSDKGIILNDYSLALSQKQEPRSAMIQPILASMATCTSIINTAMYGCADYNLVRAEDEAEYNALITQLKAINSRILKGQRFGAVHGQFNMESLKTSSTTDLQGLWETFNSLDNFRKSTAGIANSGVFNKKERMLQQEQQLNGSNSDSIYDDGLEQRQRFCDLFNQYYGMNMWCMSKQTPTDVEQANDVNGNGSDDGTEKMEVETDE